MTTKFILSVDPGKATGIAFFEWSGIGDPSLLLSGEPQPEEFAGVIRKILTDVIDRKFVEPSAQLIVVCERFVINAQTVRNSQAPYSLEQIGVLKQVLRDYNMSDQDILWQAPADAKAMFPNEALKKVGYWHKGGEGHAMDALRHGLLRMVKLGWKPSALLS